MDSAGVMVAPESASLFGRMPASSSRQVSCLSQDGKYTVGYVTYVLHAQHTGIWKHSLPLSCFSQAFPHIQTHIFLISHHIPCRCTESGLWGSLIGFSQTGEESSVQFMDRWCPSRTYSLKYSLEPQLKG